MSHTPKTSRLSILSLLLSLFPLVGAIILIIGWMVYPDFFGPPPDHSSPLVGPSAGSYYLWVFGSFVTLPASLLVGIISTVRIHRRNGEVNGQVFAWVGFVISSLISLCPLIIYFAM